MSASNNIFRIDDWRPHGSASQSGHGRMEGGPFDFEDDPSELDLEEIEEGANDLIEELAAAAADFSKNLGWDLLESVVSQSLSDPVDVPSLHKRIGSLEEAVIGLSAQVELLIHQAAPITVTVDSLAPEPFLLSRPFEVVIRPSGDEYLAGYLDAGIETSGDTQAEALANLKSYMADTVEMLEELGEDKLGPGPRRQLAVLSGLMKSH